MRAGLMRPPPYCTGPSTVPPSREVGGRKKDGDRKKKEVKKERKGWGGRKRMEGIKGVVERERKKRESGHLPALKWIKVI